MVNVNKLRGAVVERGMNMTMLAKAAGLDRATLYRRLSDNGETLLIREVDAIAKALGLSADEAAKIFFAQYVA